MSREEEIDLARKIEEAELKLKNAVLTTRFAYNEIMSAATDVLAGTPCNARPMATQYLSWDATTGEPKWNTLGGADQSIFGASLVYDAPRTRMILFGGTSNISTGSGTT